MWRRRQAAHAVGIWLRGAQPRILSDRPAEADWRRTVSRANDLESGIEHN